MRDYNEVKNLIEACEQRIKEKRLMIERLTREREEMDKKFSDKIDAVENQSFNLWEKERKYKAITIGQERIEEFINKISAMLGERYKVQCGKVELMGIPMCRKYLSSSELSVVVSFINKTDSNDNWEFPFWTKFDKEAIEANSDELLNFLKATIAIYEGKGEITSFEIPWNIAKDMVINLTPRIVEERNWIAKNKCDLISR